MDDFLIYLGYLILLINLILYAFSFFRKGKANVFFVAYLAFSFVMQFSMELVYSLHKSNLVLVNIFVIGQMLFLGMFYHSILKLKIQKLFVKWGIIIALLILGIQFCIEPDLFFKFNLFEITVTSLMIVVFALLHFYNMLTESKTYYYVTIAVILFMLGSTILYLVGNLTLTLSENLKYLSWKLNAFLFIIYHLLIMYEWKRSFYKN
ncbi:hypothetical protein [Flavobacterium defluvii]|uniref:YhhN-like protein n=1 Tax=Flavobacterium defluvii TaxID=370979 RepID=A0A1M5MVH7_9FLAO|nr:hypothetical protein [Flavobacterium defluvii]SHG81340.1 hypothetical protein SAMN05443663_10412 [Flavobacterium defluvii]